MVAIHKQVEEIDLSHYGHNGIPLDITAHKMIAYIAEEMAGAEYEALAHFNKFYRQYPNQKRYIRYRAPLLRKEARRILAEQLTRNIPESEKELIAEALILDNELPKTGGSIIRV